MMRIVIILLCFMLGAMTLAAQDIEQYEVIKLKDGSKYIGMIQEMHENGDLLVQFLDGREMLIPGWKVSRVKQKTNMVKSYNFKEEGWYRVTQLGINEGFSLTQSFGYRFHRLIGAGIGTGFENFQPGEGKRVIPVFAEARGFLKSQQVTPYYSLRLGYGFGVKNEAYNITSARGGFLFSPEIGYRLGGSGPVNLTIGAAVHLQNVGYIYRYDWNETVRDDEYDYRRYEFRIGIIF